MSIHAIVAKLLLTIATFVAINLLIDQTHIKAFYYLWYLGFGSLMVLSLTMVTNRFYLSLVISCMPLLLIIAMDKAKFAILQDHLRWFDISFIGMAFDDWATAFDFLIDFVDGWIGFLAIAGMLAASLLGVALARWEGPAFGRGSRFSAPARRAIGLAGVAILPVLMTLAAAPTLEAKGRALFWPQAHYRYGTLLFFLGSRRDLATRPDEAALPAISEQLILDRLAAEPVDIEMEHVAALPAATAARPDIVIWINESTFDLRDLEQAEGAGAQVRQRDLAMFRPQPQTIALGPLAVSVFGGNSWTTEFALQAGARSEWFGVHASYTTVALAPFVQTTLFRELAAAGYHIEVLYGFEGSYFGEQQAYGYYGTHEFHDPEELSSRPLADKLAVLEDQALAAAVTDRLAEASAQPRCLLVFTMANHGPYGAQGRRRDSFTVTDDVIQLWGPGLPLGIYDYLERLRETDQVIGGLTRDLMARPRRTLFVHFGDHKPSLPEVRFSADVKYQSYYHMLANFGAPRDGAAAAPRRRNDVIFLPGQILAQAVPQSGRLFAANRHLGEACRDDYRACLQQQRSLALSYQTLAMKNFDFRWPRMAKAGGLLAKAASYP